MTNQLFPPLNGGTGSAGRELLTANRTYFVRTPPTTVTITIATPGVVTWTAHGLTANAPVVFGTTGALPTGLVVGTVYFVVGASITTNTFQVSATSGGAAINTSGSQSGTHSASTGNDSNTGLSNTATTAFLSIQRAIDVAAALDNGIFNITIQLATGTYNLGTDGIILKSGIGSGSILINGGSTTSSDTIINNSGTLNSICTGVSLTTTYTIKHIRFNITNFENAILFRNSFVIMETVYVNRQGSSDQAIQLSNGASIQIRNGMSIQGSFQWVFNLDKNASVDAFNGGIFTIVGTPVWNVGFVLGRFNSSADFSGTTFSGSATGNRCSLAQGSHVRQNTASPISAATNGSIDATSSLVSA